MQSAAEMTASAHTRASNNLGFAVPHDILERVIAKEPTPIRVAGRVTRLQTSRDSLIIPRINYTSDDLKVGVAA